MHEDKQNAPQHSQEAGAEGGDVVEADGLRRSGDPPGQVHGELVEETAAVWLWWVCVFVYIFSWGGVRMCERELEGMCVLE